MILKLGNDFHKMNKNKSAQFTRRDFLRRAATASGTLAFPLIVPSRLFGADAPSNRVRVGHIGCGAGLRRFTTCRAW